MGKVWGPIRLRFELLVTRILFCHSSAPLRENVVIPALRAAFWVVILTTTKALLGRLHCRLRSVSKKIVQDDRGCCHQYSRIHSIL